MMMMMSIELCCPVVFDLSCNGLFRFLFFVLFVFLLLPLMANKVVCDGQRTDGRRQITAFRLSSAG